MRKSLYAIILQQDGGNRINSPILLFPILQKRFVIISGSSKATVLRH